MIERMLVINFQKHEKRIIKFGPLTVIVGENGKGKSGLLRGLSFVCLNRTSPSHIRHGRSFTKVILTVDGKKVTRKKGKGENKYTLDGKTFSAISKSDIPEEIAQLLNVSPDNFRRQFDAHFWLSDTPGQVAKHLNRIVNLDLIDRSIGKISAKLRAAKSDLKLTVARKRQARETVKELAWVPILAQKVAKLEALEKRLNETESSIVSLRGIIDKLARLKSDIDLRKETLVRAQKVLETGKRLQAIAEKRDTLQKLLTDIATANKRRKTKPPDITKLVNLRKKGDDLSEKCQSLSHLIDDLKQAEEYKCRTEREAKKAKAEFEEKTKGNCPICGSPMKTPLSPSSVRTYTSATKRRYQEPKERTGRTFNSDTSDSSGMLATDYDAPF